MKLKAVFPSAKPLPQQRLYALKMLILCLTEQTREEVLGSYRQNPARATRRVLARKISISTLTLL